MTVREELIKLYSSGTVDSVHNNKAYQELCQKNMGDRVFDAERYRIEDFRFQLDQLMMKSTSCREQVQNALRHLRRLASVDEKKLFQTLVLKSYASNWSTDSLKYYEEKSSFLIDALDYFLSFTNRNPNSDHQNDINRNHKHFICDSLGKKSYKQADLCNCNLVAETVHYHLTSLSLSGFYYPRHIEDNKNVEEKLSKNCIDSLAFVQLVQAAMFRNIPESRNWCFFEYDLAHKKDSERVLFVQIEEDIREDGIHADFDTWYQDFANRDSLKLIQTRNYSWKVIDENRRIIRKKLKQQIEDVVNRIYRAIPD